MKEICIYYKNAPGRAGGRREAEARARAHGCGSGGAGRKDQEEKPLSSIISTNRDSLHLTGRRRTSPHR